MDSVESDPWGWAYKIVSRKISGSPPGAKLADRENVITNGQFPSVMASVWSEIPLWSDSDADPVPFTHEVLAVAASRIPSGKSPGPGGVLN